MTQAAPQGGHGSTLGWRTLNGVLLLLALALLAACVVLLARGPSAGAADGRAEALSRQHEAVARAAVAEAVAFLTVDHRNMDPLVEKVLAGATGEFRREYRRDRDELVTRARKARAVASARAVAVGVARLSERSAVVLVAADQTVRNSATKGRPQRRIHRLELTLQREDRGWSTSRLRVVG